MTPLIMITLILSLSHCEISECTHRLDDLYQGVENLEAEKIKDRVDQLVEEANLVDKLVEEGTLIY